MPEVKRILLLSGGMDSLSLAYWLRPDACLTVNYGQRAAAGELRAASAICADLKLRHYIEEVDCRAFGAGDMSDSGRLTSVSPASDWWPFRNQLLVTLAGMKAVVEGYNGIVIGSVCSDSTHVDGSSIFYQSLSELLALQEGHLRLEVPGLHMTTQELIRISGVPKSFLLWSHSCHTNEYACGRCRGCNKYREILREIE